MGWRGDLWNCKGLKGEIWEGSEEGRGELRGYWQMITDYTSNQI